MHDPGLDRSAAQFEVTAIYPHSDEHAGNLTAVFQSMSQFPSAYTGLQELSLAGNSLPGLLPAQLPLWLPALQTLDLTGIGIQGSLPAGVHLLGPNQLSLHGLDIGQSRPACHMSGRDGSAGASQRSVLRSWVQAEAPAMQTCTGQAC